jgi:hypothetical protein
MLALETEDIGAFKTPFLRDDAIEFFNQGGERNPFLNAEMKASGVYHQQGSMIW